jgi:hypothetical protein
MYIRTPHIYRLLICILKYGRKRHAKKTIRKGRSNPNPSPELLDCVLGVEMKETCMGTTA